MLRWLILIFSFGVWLASMALIYDNFSPRAPRDSTPGTQTALKNLFSENYEPRQRWSIFIDIARLNENPDAPMTRLLQGSTGRPQEPAPPLKTARPEPWDGVNQSRFVPVGWIENTIKRVVPTRAEQLTELEIVVPPDLKMPVLQMLGNLSYDSRTEITQERGLERFKSRLSVGFGIEISTLGIREQENLALTYQIWQHGREVVHELNMLPVGDKAAPGVDLMPFQNNPDIKVGYSWDIAMLDTSSAMGGGSQPKIVVVKATCSAKTMIEYNGERRPVFAAETEDGRLRAWYSGDGVVLKQTFSIADVLDIMVVRDVETESAPPRPRPRMRR
jgi:hypothetical protein